MAVAVVLTVVDLVVVVVVVTVVVLVVVVEVVVDVLVVDVEVVWGGTDGKNVTRSVLGLGGLGGRVGLTLFLFHFQS